MYWGPIALEPGLADVDFYAPTFARRQSEMVHQGRHRPLELVQNHCPPDLQRTDAADSAGVSGAHLYWQPTAWHFDAVQSRPRMDWTRMGGLVCGSWLYKDLTDYIETVRCRRTVRLHDGHELRRGHPQRH